jgi:Ca2+-binding RTX toxin-like protein
VVVGRVDEATGAELADDILIKPGATAGSFVAGWRPAGSTAAFKNVSFTIPDDVDAVWVRGGGGNDRIEIDPAVAAPIYVDGGTGNDTILGGNGPDILYGGAGSDTIDGRGGNDLIFGDGGTDTTAGSVVVVAPADEGNDTISGGAGIDVLLGGGGDDRIDGGAGFDQVRGEAGNDILTNTGDSFGDDMSGGAGNDVLIGGAGGDTLTGGAGDDTLIGGGGPDTMFGDDDSGQATGGPGNDVMVGELGRDTMRGGAGSDVLKAFLDNDLRATVAARTGLSLPAVVPPTPAQDAALTAALEAERTQLLARQAQLLAIPQAQLTPDQKKELQQVQNRLNDVESDLQDLRRFNSNRVDDLRGGDGNDALFGSPFNDRLDGEGGDDTINQSDLGQFGGDVIFGGAGTDAFVILGTAAADTITLRLEADRLVTVLGTGGVLLGKFGEAGTTGAFTEVETLRIMAGDGNDRVSLEGLAQKVPLDGRIEVFGEAGDDTIDAGTYQGKTLLDGGAGNDQLTGGLVSDNLFGGDGNDTLIGGAGNDTLAGGLGDDSLDGGTGDDRLFGDSAPLTLVINGVERSALQLGPIGTIFTPPPGGNDTVIGGAGNDFIDGGSGDDTLLGDSGGILQVGGNDTLIGGAGNDKLVGGFGHDSLDGGDGDDTLFGDNEIVIVADAGGGNDTLIGGAGGDKLFGQGGNDLLIGNAVDGTADGRRDQLDGGSGTDTARVSFKEAETLIGIESVDVARPAGVLFLVRNDQSVAAVDTTTGQVWVAGLLQGNRSRLARMSPDGTELYFVDTINQLWKFTKGGQQTIQQTGVQSFFFDAFGRLRIVPIL